MAYPTVGHSGAAYYSATTSPSLDYSTVCGADPSSGDLIIVALCKDDDVEPSAKPSGFTEVYSAEASNAMWLWVGVKESNGTETTADWTTDSEPGVYGALIIDAGTWADSGTLTDDVEWGAGTASSSASDMPLGTMVTASWGSDDNLHVGVSGWDGNKTASQDTTNWPDNWAYDVGTANGDAGLAMATVESTSAQYGDSTLGTLSAAEQTCGVSIVVKPSGAASTTATPGAATTTATANAATVSTTGPFDFMCGAECDIHTRTNVLADAQEHWAGQSLDGTGAVWDTVTTPTRWDHGRAHRFHAGSTTTGVSNGLPIYASSATEYYVRFSYRFDDAPANFSNDFWLSVAGNDTALAYYGITWDDSEGKVRVDADGTFSSTNDFAPSADTWYDIEYVVDGVAKTVKWRYRAAGGSWSTSETVSGSGTALSGSTNYLMFGIGSIGGTGLANSIAYVDDIVAAAGSHALGLYDATGTNGRDGTITIIRPDSDGTHSFDTTGDFTKTGTNMASTDTDANEHLDAADMAQTSEYIAGAGAASGEYVEVHFDASPSGFTGPKAAHAVVALDEGSAGDLTIQVSDNGTDWSSDSYTGDGTGQAFAGFVVGGDGTAPSGSSWTTGLVDSLRARLRSDSTDTWTVYGVGIEVEYESYSAGTTATPNAATTTATANAAEAKVSPEVQAAAAVTAATQAPTVKTGITATPDTAAVTAAGAGQPEVAIKPEPPTATVTAAAQTPETHVKPEASAAAVTAAGAGQPEVAVKPEAQAAASVTAAGAGQPEVAIGVEPGVIGVTASALQPDVAVGKIVTPDAAAVTAATGGQPEVKVAPEASVASVTAAGAGQPEVKVAPEASVAAATAAGAGQPEVRIAPEASAASATAAGAGQPEAHVAPEAGVVGVTATAQQPDVAIGKIVTPDEATVTAAAGGQPEAHIKPEASAAAVTATVQEPTVVTSGAAVTATPDEAAVTASVPQAAAKVAPEAGVATVTVAAQQVESEGAVEAQVAAVTIAAQTPETHVSPVSDAAAAVAQAWGGITSIDALPATATATAQVQDAKVGVVAHAGLATATASAYDVTGPVEVEAPAPSGGSYISRLRYQQQQARQRLAVDAHPAAAMATAYRATVVTDDTDKWLLELLGVIPPGAY